MKGCTDECHLEVAQQDDRSVGPVQPDETICRAAYDPMHFKGTTLKASVLRSGDLFSGQLSVWRASNKSKLSVEDVAEICDKYVPEGHSLASVLGVSAKDIREARLEGVDGRLFCVVDETDTDANGGYHEAHAHIKICASLKEEIASPDCKEFVQIKNQLLLLFRSTEASLYPASA